VVSCNLTNLQELDALKMVKAENVLYSGDSNATTNVDVELLIAKQIDALRIELNTLACVQRLIRSTLCLF
jgi:hypothetical protein